MFKLILMRVTLRELRKLQAKFSQQKLAIYVLFVLKKNWLSTGSLIGLIDNAAFLKSCSSFKQASSRNK